MELDKKAHLQPRCCQALVQRAARSHGGGRGQLHCHQRLLQIRHHLHTQQTTAATSTSSSTAAAGTEPWAVAKVRKTAAAEGATGTWGTWTYSQTRGVCAEGGGGGTAVANGQEQACACAAHLVDEQHHALQLRSAGPRLPQDQHVPPACPKQVPGLRTHTHTHIHTQVNTTAANNASRCS
jgi:hypothetical protein